MLVLIALASVLVPALFYGALLYVFDVHEREPLRVLALVFVLGALCVPLCLVAERGVDQVLPYLAGMRAGVRGDVLVGAFLVVSPIEELSKLLAVLVGARRFIDEPVDGVVYAGTAALGFASAEGLMAVQGPLDATVVWRALLSMPGHLCFSALWGAGLGALLFWGRRLLPAALVAWCAALLAHGTYDFVLIFDGGRHRGGVVAVLVVAALVAVVLFRALLSASPFRKIPERSGLCPTCERPYLAHARFCAGCGTALSVQITPPLPLGFVSTLLAFVAQALVVVVGSVLFAALLHESAHSLWNGALSAPSGRTALVWLLVILGAVTAAGLSASFGGRHALLEVLLASLLCVLCTMLFVALVHPEHVLRALGLVPLSLGAASSASFSLRRATRGRRR